MKIAGIDEAGKGPVIGPLVVCGVSCEEKDVEALKKLGVKDSKRLSPEKRKELAEKLKEIVEHETIVISPEELNSKMEKTTINEILKEACVEIISKLNPDVVFVDSFDVKPERLEEELKRLTGKKVVAMHEGEREVVVAAASIIAKCLRDEIIEELKREYGDFGSGYASDEKTRRWLEEQIKRGKIPEIVRKRWKTVENLRKKFGQKKLFEF
ncbi:ribonuclease HII [Ferroglobus placidus DSM 10642]|uniref:Ribonuclease HII n=1 Tax=Ferroglobus placidus (strain DSM 10642 / AEDII12DO) TaxID=589924 RepID=D3RZ66_FERPA|nr:ribonuclease HII [Ferroglobus placidus]ADC65779.1 ribonuclease HII [Ferroglobus placidus DSM 10642]